MLKPMDKKGMLELVNLRTEMIVSAPGQVNTAANWQLRKKANKPSLDTLPAG